MTGERWSRVKELLEAASLRAGDERLHYLRAACDGDADLQHEVEDLLRAGDEVPEFLERPALSGFSDELEAENAAALVGQRVGAWRLTELVATGGMGAVYRAARDDGQFQQVAALKLIRRDLASPQLTRQFQRERQTLANLNHPNVARLLDGGVHERGAPYFVMEFVAGAPIDEYCAARRAPLRQRLELFLRVCDAIMHAHQNLIVHRDLKPGNILVTDAGQPKVVDFGIARSLDEAGLAATLTRDAGSRRLTPQYASPEQIRGEPLTTATDVYSLGVVLYRLLTGQSPYRVESGLLYDIERAVCEQDPEKPSTAALRTRRVAAAQPGPGAENRGVERPLPGDLDAIVLLALRKNPRERYGSVEAFARDIRRFLAGEPVEARTPSWRYLTGKYLRRHRVGLAAGAAVTLSLAAGLVGMSWQAREASQQRDAALAAQERAEAESARATAESRTRQQVNDFLENMLAAVEPDRSGRDVTVRETLDQAAEQVPRDLADQPDIAASIYHTLANSYSSLGRFDDAERMLRTAIEIRRRLADAELAATINDLGVALYQQRDYPGAEGALREALCLLRQADGGAPEQVARCINNLAATIKAQGRLDEAEPLYLQALEQQRLLLGERHEHLAETLNNLGGLRLARGDFAQAEAYCRQVLALREDLLGRDHPDTAQSLDNLGVALARQDRHAEARPLHEEAADILRARLGDDHPALAAALTNLGSTLLALKEHDGAIEALARAEQIRLAKFGANDRGLAYTRLALGRCYASAGQPEKAKTLLEASYAGLRAALGAEHALTRQAGAALAALNDATAAP